MYSRQKKIKQIIQELDNLPAKNNFFPKKVLNLIDFAQEFAQIWVFQSNLENSSGKNLPFLNKLKDFLEKLVSTSVVDIYGETSKPKSSGRLCSNPSLN